MSQSTSSLRVDPDDQDVYFSVDVETDGPIPGVYSMLSFGIVEAGAHNGRRFIPNDDPQAAYWELKPVSEHFDREALAVSGLDRDALLYSGMDPHVAMAEAQEWISQRAKGRRPIMVASPAVFDWMFIHWYFVNFLGESPFAHSGCFDVKTALAVRFDRPVAMAGRRNLPIWLGQPSRSHNALEDARDQAQLFRNLLEWQGLSSHPAY